MWTRMTHLKNLAMPNPRLDHLELRDLVSWRFGQVTDDDYRCVTAEVAGKRKDAKCRPCYTSHDHRSDQEVRAIGHRAHAVSTKCYPEK